MVERIKKLALAQYESLLAQYSRQSLYGGQLFLGKNYGKNNILFLGLSPKRDGCNLFNVDPLSANVLTNRGKRSRYQKNAFHALTHNEGLKEKLQNATFMYCCPFKTRNWAEISSEKKNLYLKHSRPLVKTILHDCQPDFIIVSGQDTIEILSKGFNDIFSELKEKERINFDRSHHWDEYTAIVNGQQKTILKTPNFTYASNKEKLHNLSNWLGDKTSKLPH